MEENYIAHKDNERNQLLLDHLRGTAKRAGAFADKFGKGDWDIAVECYMILENTVTNFNERLKRIIRLK